MNYNKCIIAGNLTRDPDLRFTSAGTALCKLGIAVNETYTSNGEKKQRTVFVDATAWSKTAEVIAKYLTKGDPIFIEGRLDFSTWVDKETGKNRSKLAVTCEKFQFVGSKKDVSAAETSAAPADDVPF